MAQWRGSALAPRTCEGGATSSQTGGGGSPSPAYLSQKSVKNRTVNTARSFFAFCCREFVLPPVPVCALVPPPSQVRGARPRTASTRTPFNKQLYKFQFLSQLFSADNLKPRLFGQAPYGQSGVFSSAKSVYHRFFFLAIEPRIFFAKK